VGRCGSRPPPLPRGRVTISTSANFSVSSPRSSASRGSPTTVPTRPGSSRHATAAASSSTSSAGSRACAPGRRDPWGFRPVTGSRTPATC
jgi:hypothetical protein